MSAKKLLGSEVIFIDPTDCGSTVGYKVYVAGGWLYAEVALNDCSRKATWSFGHNKDAIVKIDKVIGMMKKFKKKLIAGQAEWKRQDVERRKKKLAQKGKKK